MAPFLDDLKPLIALVRAGPQPGELVDAIVEIVTRGKVGELYALLGLGAMSKTALEQARLIADGRLLPEARDRALVLKGAVEALERPGSEWTPVMTVASFMRRAIPEGRVTETRRLLQRLVDSAESRIVLAAPFLDQGLRALLPGLQAFLERGGQVLLITRDLQSSNSPNRKAVELLRGAAAPSRGELLVHSWEGKELGVHLKTLVVDSTAAYVGSANFTWGGLADHFEMGVHVTGVEVRSLELALEQLASELYSRSKLSSR